MASKDIRDLRWTLEFVVDAVGKTGEEVIVVGRDGQTELAAIIASPTTGSCAPATTDPVIEAGD